MRTGTGPYDISYGYDAVGNRTGMTRNGTAYSYVYDDHDKLTSASGGGKNAWFYYSPKGNPGNITGDLFGGWELWYDDENRLTSVTYPGGTDSFTYNALGQRTRALLNGTARRYVYNGERVLEETNDANATQVRYTTAGSSYFAPLLHFKRSDGSMRYPLYDATGSVLRVVDGSATVTDSYTLDAFGRLLSSTGTTPNPYRFGGDWGYITDTPGSGLLQLGHRVYWPELGRFLQQDPIGDGANWYAYADDNPVTGIDPEGLTDIFVPIEATVATPWGGIDASVGIVIDTDNLWHSGFFSWGGPAFGVAGGLSVGVGVANEIEGFSQNISASAILSGTGSFAPVPGDPCALYNLNGGAVTVGPGLGWAYSQTQTDTLTLEHIVARLKSLGRRAMGALR